ncbi:ABC transporter permease [Paenibacillus aceris]|uniref:Aldouronate transport system permease protein n=1 Tax=Paenibacillus aceris TaxID=869555 RepID=A0ABS4I0A8_9BACL|nr:ABC transporter permease subunit [Paenibacillus aceris]MBP1964353.1 putative aldouronate transport system permease protein [Paenibacillus aceris]NHW36671.1 sugar ABC transporter permease [Paenibacillus aceris]
MAYVSIDKQSMVKTSSLRKQSLKKHLWLYMLAAPGVLYFIIFHYVPMWGVLLAFQEYSPYQGFFKSDWVGFEHFQRFFAEPTFFQLLKNTLLISFYNLFFFFPFTIILALLLNEVHSVIYKRFVQTVVYLPHFVSWVIIVGISFIFFGPTGVFNHYLDIWFDKNLPFLMSNEWFRPLIVLQHIWKDAGWGTIILLAALAGINPELYEAVTVDGANRWHRIWYITLPGIRSTIVILLILRLGSVMDSNFQQVFLMWNNFNEDVSNVFDLYVYKVGLQRFEFSFSIAVGLFNSVVGLILMLLANYMAKLFKEEGIF